MSGHQAPPNAGVYKFLAPLQQAFPRLLSLPSGWERPANGNYSTWENQLNSRLFATCYSGSDKLRNFESYNIRAPGESVFRDLRSQVAYKRLLEYMRTSHILQYMATKTGWIFLLVVALILLVAAIASIVAMVVFMCKPSLRRKEKIDDNKLYKSHHPRLLKWRTLTLFSVGLSLALMVALEISGALHLVKFDKGIHSTLCDSYLTFKGFWFGSKVATHTPGVTKMWQGNQMQWDTLQRLLIEVTPGPKNPLRKTITDIYTERVLPTLDREMHNMGRLIERIKVTGLAVEALADKMVDDLNLTEKGEIPGEDYGWPQTDMHPGYIKTLIDKLQSLNKELMATLGKSKKLFNANIEKYLGDKSLLFKEAYDATHSSIVATNDVNYVMGGMTQKLVEHESKISALRIIVVTVIATWISVSFAICIMGAATYFLVFRADQTKQMPSKHVKRMLCSLYSITVILASISFIVSAVFFTASSIGGDVCTAIDDTIFRMGDWNAFPVDLWKKTKTGSTNMASVLDTCVKNTGSGDIASALGISGSVVKLYQTMDKTKRELRQEVIAMNMEAKAEKVESLQRLIKASSYYWWPTRPMSVEEHNYMGEDVEGLSFPAGTRYLMPRNNNPDSEPYRVLCALLGTDYLSLANQCKNGLVFQIIGTGTLINIINAKAAAVPAATTRWCMKSLDEDASFSCPTGGVIIDSTWPVKDALYAQAQVDASRKAIFADKGEREARMFFDAIYTAVHLEKIVDYKVVTASYPGLSCPGNKANCTMQEFLPQFEANMTEYANQLKIIYNTITSEILTFVESVTIGSMEAMLGQAVGALRDFNCRFVGASLKIGTERGLCHITFPSTALLGLFGILSFIAYTVIAVVTFLVWDRAVTFAVVSRCNSGIEVVTGIIDHSKDHSSHVHTGETITSPLQSHDQSAGLLLGEIVSPPPPPDMIQSSSGGGNIVG